MMAIEGGSELDAFDLADGGDEVVSNQIIAVARQKEGRFYKARFGLFEP